MGHRRGVGRCLFPREADETAQLGPIDGVVPIDDMMGAFDEGGSWNMLLCRRNCRRWRWCEITWAARVFGESGTKAVYSYVESGKNLFCYRPIM